MPPRRLPIFLSLVTLVLASPPTRGDDDSRRTPDRPKTFDVAAIDTYVDAVVRARAIPGLSLAVVRDDKIAIAKGYGRRSLGTDLPVVPETPFAIGSVTKQFTSASVLLLAEDGKLTVGDKVARFLPKLGHAREIDLHQLMTHTSGYPDYYPLDFVDRRLARPIAVDDLLRVYAGERLDFEPGTRWSYSNTGYAALGRVVEIASGEPFGSFLRRRIFDPVGMTSTSFEPKPGDLARARGYLSFALGPPEEASPEADGWIYAAGAIWSTASDLARWDLALSEGRVLRPESFRLMTAPARLADGRLYDYGCGLSISREGGEIVLAHTGGVSGFRAYNAFIPRTKSAVITLVNSEDGDGGIGASIRSLLVEGRESAPVPTIFGPSPREVALEFFRQSRAGSVDRSLLGDEFANYLTDARLQAAAPRLKALGEPVSVDVGKPFERGGMAVCTVRLVFPNVAMKGLLYRSTDGRVQQLLFERD